MNDITERMASNVHEAWRQRNRRHLSRGGTPWSELPETSREEIRADMRAALQSLREPTEAMVEAGSQVIRGRYGHSFEPNGIFTAMIDAALISHQETDDGK